VREIKKLSEPPELTAYRLLPNAQYDGDASFTPVKDKIRQRLLKEQGYLCAYCMRRIAAHVMKVEHWHCQDNYPTEQLDYKNMLGACLGNEGQPQSDQTCDTRKANRELKYHPANPDHRIEHQIKYRSNGEVYSDDQDFNQQLGGLGAQARETVLNLNNFRLKENRKAVVDGMNLWFASKAGGRTKGQIQKQLESWMTPDQDGMLKEYCGVAVYFLCKRLNRLC
jgi:uncharacterized protein (TIGR02646 family)